MEDRYARDQMKLIWSEKNKYDTWLLVEKLVVRAWALQGVIPTEDWRKIENNASYDIDRIKEIEEETKHDVVAFTRALSETLGPERRWIHYGLTSSDVVDTAQGCILSQANKEIHNGLVLLIDRLEQMARRYRYTVMIGRTHGIHAEPTTFGLKMALWKEEMERNLKKFRLVAKDVQVGKISGAVGTYANVNPEVEISVCRALGIEPAKISNQILQRDRYAGYIGVLALIASSIEKFATEIRHLQRTEVREVEEGFASGQTGSSAMPHKRNPIRAENLCGLSRVVRGYMVTAYENINLWHERDISHSSAERIILRGATSIVDFMIHRFIDILDGLKVNEDIMKENIERTKGLIFSQNVLQALIDKGLSREEAYKIVQRLAMVSWETGEHFKDLLKRDAEVTNHLTESEIDSCFSIHRYLKHIDIIYRRLGIDQ